MTPSEERAFAHFVVELTFCTKEQLDECLHVQSYEPDPKPSLAEILLFKGYLTPTQEREARELLPPQEAGSSEPPDPRVEPAKPALPQSAAPPAAKADAPAASRPKRDVATKLTCGFCGHEFEGDVDRFGRASCPECHASFTPRPSA